MMLNENDEAVLTRDLPQFGLKRGDVGTVVLVHAAGGYDVEFMTFDGETIAVASLSLEEVRPVAHGEVPHARELSS